MTRRDVTARVAVSAAIALLIPIAVHAYLGTSARYVGDDYCAASVFQTEGLMGGQAWFYRYWNAVPMMIVAIAATDPFLTARVSWILPAVMLAVWVAAAVWTTRRIAAVWGGRGWPWSAVTALLLVSATINSAPHVVQSIYLRVPMLAYSVPLVLATLFAGFLVPRLAGGSHGPGALAGTFVFAFIAGLFGPVYVALQTTMLGLGGMLALLRRHRPSLLLLGVGVAGSLVALVVILSAPGNASRQSYFPPPPGVFTIAKWSFLYAAFMFARPMLPLFQELIVSLVPAALGATPKWLPVALEMGTSPVTPLLVLSVPGAFAFVTMSHATAERHRTLARAVAIAALPVTFLLVMACMAPGAYGTSSPPPPRALIIPNFVLMLGCTAFSIALATRIRAASPARSLPTAAVVMMVILGVWHVAESTATAWSRRGEFQAWATRWDAADRDLRAARAAGISDAKITPVGAFGGVGSLAGDTNDWVNVCAARYYGVTTISGHPVQ